MEEEIYEFIESVIEDMIKEFKQDKENCEILHESTERIEGKIEALEDFLSRINS